MNETDKSGQAQDDELAAYTDALLTGREASRQEPPLANVVRALAAVTRAETPPERLRGQVRRQIAAEWARQQPSLAQSLGRLLRGTGQRWVWGAVAVAALLVTSAALFLPSNDQLLLGTATGGAGPMIAIVALGVIALAAVVWWARRR